MHRRIAILAMMALGSSAFGVPVGFAQKKPKGGGKGKDNKEKDKDNEVQLDGTIKQVSSQGLVVETGEGNFLVGIGPNTQVALQGKASKGFLAAGAFVEFEVDLDRSGNATSDVAAITFIDASPLNPAGLFPTTLPTTGATKPDKNENAKTSFLVRGKIMPPRNGMFTVQAGGKTISAKVSEDVTLNARLSNWSLAVAGDQVKGKAELIPQPNTGLTRVVAHKLNIHASQAIEPGKGK